MGLRLGLIFLLLAFAMVAESSLSTDAAWGLTHPDHRSAQAGGIAAEMGLVADWVDAAEETMMDSEVARRTLAAARKFISYDALQRDRVPCSRRGRSYYNCGAGRSANPYRRGCSHITRCARYTG